MKILITGATGFIGRKLINSLLAEEHEVFALVRSLERAHLPKCTLIKWSHFQDKIDFPVESFDVVVNLMGENIAGGRWTESRKKKLIESRVEGTKSLIDQLTPLKITKWVQASAVGYYGNTVSAVNEDSPKGKGFLSDLTEAWEGAAATGEGKYDSICYLRLGVVLGDGGALAKMLPAFKAGIAGRLGSGRQFMPWVHMQDVVSMFKQAVTDRDWVGTINVTSPNYVTNEEFTKALGSVLGRPTILPAPAFALKLALGEMSAVLLEGQGVIPKRALDLGYEFKFPHLKEALKDIVS